MAIVRAPHLGRTLIMPAEIETFLASIGVEYQRWTRIQPIRGDFPTDKILKGYEPQLETYRQKNNFAAYDVMELAPRARSAEKIRNDFKREHWHSDFESYLILAGRGICYVHPIGQPVVSVELEPSDLICIGKYVPHWCDVCAEMRFRAIRFLSRAENQSTVYTRSGIEAEYEPVYISPAYLAHAGARAR